jgi:hypothetical protein
MQILGIIFSAHGDKYRADDITYDYPGSFGVYEPSDLVVVLGIYYGIIAAGLDILTFCHKHVYSELESELV